jgi:hypothetical protein
VRLQQQVEDLRKHWQKTHEQEHSEYEKQLQRKEQRNQELQMQIGSDHTCSCLQCCTFQHKAKDTLGRTTNAILSYIRALAPGHVICYLCSSSGTTYLQLPALPAVPSAHTQNGRCDESPAGNNVAVEWAAGLPPRARSRRPLTPTGMRVSGHGIATLPCVET